MDEYQIGNFNTDSFDQMDQKRSEIRFIEQSSQVEKACRSCHYFFIMQRRMPAKQGKWDTDRTNKEQFL